MKNSTGTKTGSGRTAGGIAAAVMGALLLAPASGWLVKSEFRMAGGGPLFGDVAQQNYGDAGYDAARANKAARIAAQNPNDLGLQIAACDAQKSTAPGSNALSDASSKNAEALTRLLPRLNNRPALHATILRYLAQNSVTLSYRNDALFVENLPPHEVFAKPDANQNTPDVLEQWEQTARAGEITDEDNAYFPLMQAVGLFASHRDDEAISALLRAGQKTVFVEYLGDETEAQWRLARQMDGTQSHLALLEISASQTYPQYSLISQAADAAVASAARAEMAGDTERGFQIRQALCRVGALIRTDCHPFYGGLTGTRITHSAEQRPGGMLPLPRLTYDTKDDAAYNAACASRRQENLKRYVAYLGRIGHAEAAEEVQREFASGENYLKLRERADEMPQNVLNMLPAYRLADLWTMGAGLLLNLFLTLIAGGLCAIYARTARIKDGLPLLPAARAGIISAVVLPLYGYFVVVNFPETSSLLLVLAGAAALVFSLGKAAQSGKNAQTDLASGQKWRAAWKSDTVASFCKSYGAASAAFAGLGLVGAGGAERILLGANRFMGFACSDYQRSAGTLAGLGFCLGAFVLVGAGFAAHSLIKRTPVSVGVVRGLSRFALPIAAVLTLGYAALVSATLHDEAQANQALRTCVTQGESHYYEESLNRRKADSQ